MNQSLWIQSAKILLTRRRTHCCLSLTIQLWGNLSQYLNNLMLKICFTISFISCLYMFRVHVLIIRRSKLHYTTSGIITPIGGHLVHEMATCTCTSILETFMHGVLWPETFKVSLRSLTGDFKNIYAFIDGHHYNCPCFYWPAPLQLSMSLLTSTITNVHAYIE